MKQYFICFCMFLDFSIFAQAIFDLVTSMSIESGRVGSRLLVACVVFGYTIGKFGGLMAKHTSKKTEQREKI